MGLWRWNERKYIKFIFKTENNIHGFTARVFVQLWDYQLSYHHFSEAGSFVNIQTQRSWVEDTEHYKEKASELDTLCRKHQNMLLHTAYWGFWVSYRNEAYASLHGVVCGSVWKRSRRQLTALSRMQWLPRWMKWLHHDNLWRDMGLAEAY